MNERCTFIVMLLRYYGCFFYSKSWLIKGSFYMERENCKEGMEGYGEGWGLV